MRMLGIYGSPRKGGNTDLLLDQALQGAAVEGAELDGLYARDLRMSGCTACGGCDQGGPCVVQDEMQGVYPRLAAAHVVILAAPVFFYGMPAQLKGLIDRAQAPWNSRRLAKPQDPARYESGRGFLIAVGATKGQDLFVGLELTARYFFNALDMTYEGGLFFRQTDAKGAILEQPDALQRAYELGRAAVRGGGTGLP